MPAQRPPKSLTTFGTRLYVELLSEPCFRSSFIMSLNTFPVFIDGVGATVSYHPQSSSPFLHSSASKFLLIPRQIRFSAFWISQSLAISLRLVTLSLAVTVSLLYLMRFRMQRLHYRKLSVSISVFPLE